MNKHRKQNIKEFGYWSNYQLQKSIFKTSPNRISTIPNCLFLQYHWKRTI